MQRKLQGGVGRESIENVEENDCSFIVLLRRSGCVFDYWDTTAC